MVIGVGKFVEQLENPERQRMGIGHFVSRAAELHPDRIAIDDLLNRRTLNYVELDARINRLGRALIRQGFAVVTWSLPCCATSTRWSKQSLPVPASVPSLPPNVRLIAGEVAEYVNDHGCRTALADTNSRTGSKIPVWNSNFLGDVTPSGWEDYESLLAVEDPASLPAVTSLDDPYRLVMTGGTTGKSKGVLHSQGGSVITVLADVAEYGIGRGWQTLTILPGYHVAGMEWGMFTIFARAGTVVFPASSSFDPVAYLDEVRTRGIEYLPLVPAVINPLYDAWDGVPLETPRTVVTTAAPTPLALRRKLAELFPAADIFAAAGLSESLNLATQGPGEFLDQPAAIGEPHLDTRVLILMTTTVLLRAGCLAI